MLARSPKTRSFVRNYVLPSLLLLGILIAWDFTKPRRPANPPAPAVEENQRPNGGVPPWNAHEDLAQRSRDTLRKSTQITLDQAWSSFCDSAGREKLTKAVSAYFGLRRVQEKMYPEKWGKDGLDYITLQWATPDDNRIERLVQELYERGYLRLDAFKPFAAEQLAPLLKNARVVGTPCGT